MHGVEWTITEAPTFGADPGDLTLIGGSSGRSPGRGRRRAARPRRHRAPWHGVVSLSGPADFATAIAYWAGLGGSVAALHLKDLVATLGCTVAKKHHEKTYDCPARTGVDLQPGPAGDTGGLPRRLAHPERDGRGTAGGPGGGHGRRPRRPSCPQDLDVFPDTAHGYDYWTVELPARSSPRRRSLTRPPAEGTRTAGAVTSARHAAPCPPGVRGRASTTRARGVRPRGPGSRRRVPRLRQGGGPVPGPDHDAGHHPLTPLGIGPLPHRHLGHRRVAWPARPRPGWARPSRRRSR